MAASLSVAIVDGAPGNTVQVPGAGLVPGGSASVTLSNQGVTAAPDLVSQTITLPAVFNDSNVQIGPLPDGITGGTLTVTAGDATVATCALRACSQYVQASEYAANGEGLDAYVASLAAGELDNVLRRASAMLDAYMTESVRYLQVLERHRYQARANGAPFVFPWRPSGRPLPIVSVDQLTFVSALDLVTVFNVTDIYVNQDLNYLEILAYAIGNYALLGQLQIIGYSANVLELTYTSGFTLGMYPSEIREATILTTTALLNRRMRNQTGMGAFGKFEDKLVIDPAGIKIPSEAKVLIKPWVAWRIV